MGLLKVGDDSWGVVGSDHSPRSQEEEKQNQIQPYILPLLKKAKNKHCGWMADVCTSVCAASWTAVWWLQLCLVSRSPIGA